jgi:hypothetical protein
MAARFPLIANSSNNQIQELASGDDMDLTGNSITGAGIITATSFSGSGSNLTGVANTDYVDSINLTASGIVSFTNTTDSTSSTTGAVIISGGVGIAKSVFIGNNLSVGGTVTYEDVTNVDSVGLITAQSGVKLTGGELTLGTGATAFSPATNTLTVGTASTEVVRINAAAGILLNNGILVERVKIDSDSINTDKFVRLQDGMVHYRSSAVGAASVKPDIVSNTGINTDLAIGDTIAVTLITVAGNTSHFVSSVAIDGRTTGITTHWTGGSTPTDGGGSGVDIYAFNILKTADNTFTVVANQTKTSS